MGSVFCIDDILEVSPSGRSERNLFDAVGSAGTELGHLCELLKGPRTQQWRQYNKFVRLATRRYERTFGLSRTDIDKALYVTGTTALTTGTYVSRIEDLWIGQYEWHICDKNEPIVSPANKIYKEYFDQWIRGVIIYDALPGYQQQFRDYLDTLMENAVPNYNRIIYRLNSLLEMATEDELDNPTPVNIESIGLMVEFFVLAKIRRYPDIALTEDGLVFVEWYDSPNSLLSLLFIPGGNVRLHCLRPSDELPKTVDRLSATKGINSMVKLLEDLNAFSD